MAAGVFFLLFAVVLAAHEAWFVHHAATAEGVVTRLDRTEVLQDQPAAYTPVFVFRDAEGREHTVRSGASSNPPGYAVGDRVRVLFDPHHPESASIDSFWPLWGLAAASGIAAVAAGVLALAGSRTALYRSFERT
jgi:hypothetical protein